MTANGQRILIVDDDEDSRQVLSFLLGQAGYNVYESCDGLEAIDELKKRRYEVVLTDYRMPRLDGLQLVKLGRIVWPDTPMVIVSGEQFDFVQVAVQQGAYAFIRKPYDPAELLRVVRSAAGQASAVRTKHPCFPGDKMGTVVG
ncbi:MAG TPA: response regulator [Nitrospiraceae bacterium]|nr:response regulator [Nitrospiraceae bacterium]